MYLEEKNTLNYNRYHSLKYPLNIQCDAIKIIDWKVFYIYVFENS